MKTEKKLSEKEGLNKWKVATIILIVILILMTSFIAWGYYLLAQEEEKTKLCYYDVCGNYPDAEYLEGVCFCYDYDIIGNLIIAKTEII